MGNQSDLLSYKEKHYGILAPHSSHGPGPTKPICHLANHEPKKMQMVFKYSWNNMCKWETKLLKNGRLGPLFKTLGCLLYHQYNIEFWNDGFPWVCPFHPFILQETDISMNQRFSEVTRDRIRKPASSGSDGAVSSNTASLQILFLAQLVLLKIVAQFHKQIGTNWSCLLKYCISLLLVMHRACLFKSLVRLFF